MLAKLNMPVNYEVGLMAALIGAARGMGVIFRCNISHVLHPRRYDSIKEGVARDDGRDSLWEYSDRRRVRDIKVGPGSTG